MLYLCDQYDTKKTLTYDRNSNDYYEMLSWIMWQMGGLGPMQGKLSI
jgi:glutathione S-transferase